MHLFRSLRVRIIALYMALILLSLSLFGFIIYRDLDGRLRRGIDKLLESRAQGVADSVDTYWETEKREAARDGIPVETLSKIDNENFVKIAKRWVQDKTDDPDLLDIIVQIFDVKGALVTSSKNMPDMGTLPPEISRYVLAGKRRFDDATTGIAAGNPTRIRALTIPVVENRKTAYMIRVLSPMTSLESMSRYFALILLILIPIAVVLSGVIGSIMAGVSLRPVNRVIETIHKITAENLRLRITLPESHDEIRRLADTFNDMLARLEDSFLSQRQFIEDLTHELKTPLAVLKGELEVTLKRMRSASEYESVLESNLEEINRVIRMAENLLLLARLENNVAMLDKEILDAARTDQSLRRGHECPRGEQRRRTRLQDVGRARRIRRCDPPSAALSHSPRPTPSNTRPPGGKSEFSRKNGITASESSFATRRARHPGQGSLSASFNASSGAAVTQRHKASDWDCPSPRPSSKYMAGKSTSSASPAKGPPSSSISRPRPESPKNSSPDDFHERGLTIFNLLLTEY